MTKEKLNRWISDFRCWVAWILFRIAARITDASVHSCPEWTWQLTKVGIDRKHKFVPQRAESEK